MKFHMVQVYLDQHTNQLKQGKIPIFICRMPLVQSLASPSKGFQVDGDVNDFSQRASAKQSRQG